MPPSTSRHWIAVDVGNSAIKVGQFHACRVPHAASARQRAQLIATSPTLIPAEQLAASQATGAPAQSFTDFLEQLQPEPYRWLAIRVQRTYEHQLAGWIRQMRPQDQYLLLDYRHFGLEIDVRFPERVGADRLAGATAANALRRADRGAIIVDAGTAITVDLVTRDGVFRGGAILPGMNTAAWALAKATDALPLISPLDLRALPEPVGKATEEAIRSGIVWGSVGAVRELVARIADQLDAEPEVYFTGGSGLVVASCLGRDAQFDPHLVLRGIAQAGVQQASLSEDEGAGEP
jgi:type III pantothenate kinase